MWQILLVWFYMAGSEFVSNLPHFGTRVAQSCDGECFLNFEYIYFGS